MGDRDRSPRRDRRSGGGGGGGIGPRQPADRRIFVSNLPFETKWQDIKDLFRKEVGEVSYVKLFNDENDKPRGAGVLEFASASMAKKAIDKMHRYSMGGRNIVVKEDFDAERDQYGRIVKGSGGGGGRGGGSSGGSRSGSTRRSVGPSVGSGGQGNLGSTFGLSPQFLDSLDINTPLNNRVFVANLAYEVDERKLRDVFKLAGRVVTVELSRDKEGKSRGFAVVTFDHPVESVQAISMLHNQVLFDRRMSVRLDKLQDESERRDPNSLPDGLSGVGMGLGTGGQPLTDVAKNLPSSGVDMAAMGNMGGMAGGGGMGGGPAMGANTNMGANMAGNNAGGQAAIQAALASIATMVGLGAGAMGNNATANMGTGNVGGGNMGGGNMGNMGGGNMSGGNMGAGNMGGGNMGGGNMGSSNMGSGNMGGGNMGGGNMGGNNMGMGNMNSGNMGGRMGDGGMNDHRGGSNMGMGRGSERPSDTVIVKNLPFNCNWQALKDGFRHIGDIKFAEIKERGVGIVKFHSERDAEKAVQMMDRQRIQGDIINVGLF